MTHLDAELHLEWLRGRRSVRRFTDAPVARAVIERLLEAATTAPSSTNRQPWRFDVITDPALKADLVAAVERAATAITTAVRASPHADELGSYTDFFWEPLASAPVIVVPQVRAHPDMLGRFLRSAGDDPGRWQLPGDMDVERCGTSAAVMALLLQARSEGLGACWMAGPMVARRAIEARLGIHSPYAMLGAVAIGHPAEPPPPPPARRALDRIVRFDPGGVRAEGAGGPRTTTGQESS